MTYAKKQNSFKHLFVETEQKIETELNLFKDIPKTLKNIPHPVSKKIQSSSKDELQKKYQYYPNSPEPAIQYTNSECISFENQQSNLQKLHLSNFQNTVNILQSKRQRLKNQRFRHLSSLYRNQSQQYIGNQKVLRICKNFITKIKRNNIFSTVNVKEEDFQKYLLHEQLQGVQMSVPFTFFYYLVTTITLISFYLCQTFIFVFPQLASDSMILVVLITAAVTFAFMILVNFFSVLRINGKRITKLKEIARHYIKQGDFLVDIFIFGMILMQFREIESFWIDTILITFIFKIRNLMQKLQNLQKMIVKYVVKTYRYQRYWSLLKIIIFNFAFAHVVAILLNFIANQYPQKNWQTTKGIEQSSWYEKYAWSYYWATTIMLTVGFGDIVPTIYQQALFITFIQIISCIAFSYNISCLGNLIGIIRAQGQQIEKNRKIFEVMNNKINFSNDLCDKVQNYINQSVNINIKTIYSNLPQGYKKQVQCESNKKLLKALPFFSALLNRTIFKLATLMQRHIYYPQEIIKPIESELGIYILQSGKIGCICKKYDSAYNGIVANVIKITDITNNKLSYQIKSLGYTVVHKLKYPNFLQTLRSFNKDYEYYTFLRDKSKNIIDQYQTIPCDRCTTKHSYFNCPKYHYIPIKQNVIRRQLKLYRQSKNFRHPFIRSYRKQQNSLLRLFEYDEATRHLLNLQISNNISKKMINQHVEFKKFLVNLYNFNQTQSERLKNLKATDILRTFKTIMGISEWFQFSEQCDQFQWIWDPEFDIAANYDIYFPADNSNKVHRKFKVRQKTKKIMQLSIQKRLY